MIKPKHTNSFSVLSHWALKEDSASLGLCCLDQGRKSYCNLGPDSWLTNNNGLSSPQGELSPNYPLRRICFSNSCFQFSSKNWQQKFSPWSLDYQSLTRYTALTPFMPTWNPGQEGSSHYTYAQGLTKDKKPDF